MENWERFSNFKFILLKERKEVLFEFWCCGNYRLKIFFHVSFFEIDSQLYSDSIRSANRKGSFNWVVILLRNDSFIFSSVKFLSKPSNNNFNYSSWVVDSSCMDGSPTNRRITVVHKSSPYGSGFTGTIRWTIS